MKKYFAIIILFSSCSVLKPKTTPTPETEKIPNVMSRSVPTIPEMTVPDVRTMKIMRDSVMKMALRLDTMLYKKDRVIDELIKYKMDSRGIIDSIVRDNKKIKEDFNKFKTTWFNPDHFEVKNGVMDSVSFLKPVPQPMGRTATNYIPASPSWLSYHSISLPTNE